VVRTSRIVARAPRRGRGRSGRTGAAHVGQVVLVASAAVVGARDRRELAGSQPGPGP
jgi:hypothetical protein